MIAVIVFSLLAVSCAPKGPFVTPPLDPVGRLAVYNIQIQNSTQALLNVVDVALRDDPRDSALVHILDVAEYIGQEGLNLTTILQTIEQSPDRLVAAQATGQAQVYVRLIAERLRLVPRPARLTAVEVALAGVIAAVDVLAQRLGVSGASSASPREPNSPLRPVVPEAAASAVEAWVLGGDS